MLGRRLLGKAAQATAQLAIELPVGISLARGRAGIAASSRAGQTAERRHVQAAGKAS